MDKHMMFSGSIVTPRLTHSRNVQKRCSLTATSPRALKKWKAQTSQLGAGMRWLLGPVGDPMGPHVFK